MNRYEGMFILRPDLGKDAADKALSQIQDTISKYKGIVEELKEWSRMKLSYPIKKHKEGTYYLAHFNMVPENIKEIRKIFALNEAILRILIVNR